MATPSRFSLTGWNSTYIAPRNVNGTKLPATTPAVTAPAATAPPGRSMGSVGSMTADIPAAIQNLVSENNQSEAVRALSQALNLAISQGLNGNAGQNQLSGLADLINAQSLATARNQADRLRGSSQWLQERAKYTLNNLPYFTFAGSSMANQKMAAEQEINYQRELEKAAMPVFAAAATAPASNTSGWVSQSLVR